MANGAERHRADSLLTASYSTTMPMSLVVRIAVCCCLCHSHFTSGKFSFRRAFVGGWSYCRLLVCCPYSIQSQQTPLFGWIIHNKKNKKKKIGVWKIFLSVSAGVSCVFASCRVVQCLPAEHFRIQAKEDQLCCYCCRLVGNREPKSARETEVNGLISELDRDIITKGNC